MISVPFPWAITPSPRVFFFFFMFPTDDDVDISCLSFVWEALRLSQFKSDWPGGDRLHHYSPSAKTTLLSFFFFASLYVLFVYENDVGFVLEKKKTTTVFRLYGMGEENGGDGEGRY